jgi:diguanylate cyclase (GGDEF)-like protein/PAS domain S-box-containing protein
VTDTAANVPLHVLVVEDNPGDARLVEVYLHEGGKDRFQVDKAFRLSDALVLLAEKTADVALLDLSLPDSVGLETLARLQAAHPHLPVVVLTGLDDRELAIAALRQGAQDYLVKGQGDGEVVRRAVQYAVERSRSAQELRRSEARFRALFENAGVGVVLSDISGRFLETNPAFREMVGYSEAELAGMSFADLTHPEDLATNLSLRAEMMEGAREAYHLTKRYRGRDGATVWGRLTVTAVRDSAGEDVRFTVAVVEDITERKELEDYRRLAATVFESSGEGLFVTDSHRRIIHINPAFTEITGYDAAEVLGKTPKVLSSGRHDPEFYQRMHDQLAETGKWQGEVWNRRKSGEMFAEWLSIAAVRDPTGEITHYVAVFSDITSRKQVEERLSYQANHDPLTRLPNRTLFMERLSRALARAHRNHTVVALLFVDLDHFKQVNDTLGHLAGDALLQQVAERLAGCTRQGDTVARLAGDEFTIILEDITDPRDAAVVAQKVLRLLDAPFDLTGQEGHISSSIGIALYPVDAGDAQTLLRLADAAMYRAKHMGRNGCQFHSEVVNAQAFERLALENALRHALERDEFVLHYQPIFSATTGRLVAAEALLRWRHPDIGLVAPKQFLAIAEETGLILPMGEWVLREACRQLSEWRAGGLPSLVLNLNLSSRQLHEGELLEAVSTALEHTGLPPDALAFEVPEANAVEVGQDPSGVFARFRALGVGLTVDGFGSGTSSFAFLRRLPADALKIDPAFVHDLGASIDQDEIVNAIVAVARGLHMAVVAPNVETEAQLDYLLSCGCDRVQGYLFARPLPADEFLQLARRREVPAALEKRGVKP